MTPEELLRVAEEAAAPARKEFQAPYRAWLEKLATLSTTALALLVSLQRSYVPPNPQGGWLLGACWGALCVATLSAAWALYGEAQAHREFLRHVQRTAAELLPIAQQMTAVQVRTAIGAMYTRPKHFERAAATSAGAFAAALVSLTGYAILNL